MKLSLLRANTIAFAALLRACVPQVFSAQIAPDRVNSTLCKQPGIATVEDIEVTGDRAGPRISAFVVLTADTLESDCVVRSAAESLRAELRAYEVMLSYSDTLGRRRGVLIAAHA